MARELETHVRVYGKLSCSVSDNATKFSSRAILGWANDNGGNWHYIAPGSERATKQRAVRQPRRHPQEAGALVL